MAARVRVELTSDQLDSLWRAVHAARRSSETVKVAKAELQTLLADFSKLFAVYGEERN